MLLKKHTHEERLELGRQLSKQIVDTYGDKIVAVLVTGSTAKNLDRPYSDLEMIAIIRNGVEIPIAQYIHDGMSIQIDYVEGSSFLKDASRITFNWPLSQDQFRNRIVLYDPTAWISKLDKVVAESETADTRKRLVIGRSEEHTSELQSRLHLVCRLLLEKKKKQIEILDVAPLVDFGYVTIGPALGLFGGLQPDILAPFHAFTEASQLSDPTPGKVTGAIPDNQPFNTGAPFVQIFTFSKGQNTGFASF